MELLVSVKNLNRLGRIKPRSRGLEHRQNSAALRAKVRSIRDAGY